MKYPVRKDESGKFSYENEKEVAEQNPTRLGLVLVRPELIEWIKKEMAKNPEARSMTTTDGAVLLWQPKDERINVIITGTDVHGKPTKDSFVFVETEGGAWVE